MQVIIYEYYTKYVEWILDAWAYEISNKFVFIIVNKNEREFDYIKIKIILKKLNFFFINYHLHILIHVTDLGLLVDQVFPFF